MPRLIDANELMWHKSSLVEPRNKTVSTGKPISDDEVCAYRLGWNEAIDAIIENAPTVDAEPVRHGRWETVFMSEATGYDPTLANYIDTVFCHRCSVCKEDARLDEFGEEMISKYCPNCGAKMDEEEK